MGNSPWGRRESDTTEVTEHRHIYINKHKCFETRREMIYFLYKQNLGRLFVTVLGPQIICSLGKQERQVWRKLTQSPQKKE